ARLVLEQSFAVQLAPVEDLVGVDLVRPRQPRHRHARLEALLDDPPPLLLRTPPPRLLLCCLVHRALRRRSRASVELALRCHPCPDGPRRTLTFIVGFVALS